MVAVVPAERQADTRRRRRETQSMALPRKSGQMPVRGEGCPLRDVMIERFA